MTVAPAPGVGNLSFQWVKSGSGGLLPTGPTGMTWIPLELGQAVPSLDTLIVASIITGLTSRLMHMIDGLCLRTMPSIDTWTMILSHFAASVEIDISTKGTL